MASNLKGPGIFLAQFAGDAAPFIRDHIIRVTEKAFDDFAATGIDLAGNKKMLGIG